MDRHVDHPVHRQDDFKSLITFLKGTGHLTPKMARHLKILVVVVACMAGALLGIGSASLGHHLLSSFGEPETGRRISLEEFQMTLRGEERTAQESPDTQPGNIEHPSTH